MPCYDPFSETDRERGETARKKLRNVEAMLCMVVRRLAFANVQLTPSDYEEAGITEAAMSAWISDHMLKDRRRK